MSTAVALLADLRARGVELVAAGDRIRFRPADAVPDDVRAALRVHKPALLALLASTLADQPAAAPTLRRRFHYCYPWPDALPGLGLRRIESFAGCSDCESGSWARYGALALCVRCALRRERT